MSGRGDILGPAAKPEPADPVGGDTAAQRVVLVRHGETEWSRTGKHTGRSDIPLTTHGEAQARQLRRRLRAFHFAAVLVSPLARARRTCEIAGCAAVAEEDPDVLEWNYGEYEGMTAEEIRQERPGWTIWRDGVIGGESIEDVSRRAESVATRVRAVEGNVAIFAHGHFLRIFAARWCRFPATAAEHLAFSAGAMSLLGSDRGAPIIWSWNDTLHLLGGDGRL
jgi:broad specificity phosphatase PhoE